MPTSLFCPLEPVWGDVASVVGALATVVAAVFVWQIARRDRNDRLALLAAAERRACQVAIHAIRDAMRLRETIGMAKAAGTEATASWGDQVRRFFLDLRLGSLSERYDLTALDVELYELVLVREQHFEDLQRALQPGGRYAQTSGSFALMRITEFFDEQASALTEVARQLWTKRDPNNPPPWERIGQTA